MFQLAASQSMNTGRAPQYVIALALAEKVSDEHTTSSPSSTPTSIRARCRAAVPEESAAA